MVVVTPTTVAEQAKHIFQKYEFKRAQLFGSVARGDASIESDIDILAQFTTVPDGWTFAGIADELEQALGRNVDLVTEDGLSDNLRSRIEDDLVTIYEK